MLFGDNIIGRIKDIGIVTIKIQDILRGLSLPPGMNTRQLPVKYLPMQKNAEERNKEK